jgi:thioesterase-3
MIYTGGKKESGEQMEHVFGVTVRSTDVDMIGHVNNAKYLEYMEWARFDWIANTGFTLEELQRRQILPVVVNININYRKELKMLERIKIVSTLVRWGEKSFVVRHELFNQKGELSSDADVTMVMIDAKARRAIPLPDDLVRAFAGIQTE